MFDKNGEIKVGRDLIVLAERRELESLSIEKLNQKRNESKLILKKEEGRKLKTVGRYLVLAVVLFLLFYWGLPLLSNEYDKNSTLRILANMFKNKDAVTMLSVIAAFITIYRSIVNFSISTPIEKKHREIIKTINLILKEKEYLEK